MDTISISFAISILVLILITFVARGILKRGEGKASFLDILRDRDWYPSLSILQFFARSEHFGSKITVINDGKQNSEKNHT